MSNYITKWILEFGDKVTSPIKNMMKGVTGVTDSVDRMTESIRFTEKEAKEAFTNTTADLKDLKARIKENETELNKLQKAWAEATPGRNKAEALQALEAQRKKVVQLNKKLEETESDLSDINEQLDKFKKSDQNWSMLITGANQASEIITKVVDSLDFTTRYQSLKADIQRMSDLSGDALEAYVARVRAISAGYGQDENAIARAANSMTKQIGGTYDENLDLLEEGLKRGANINGDFLDSMNEYAPQIRSAGLTASEGIALITMASKNGVYSDKAIDSIKEASMALKEMDQAQIDALKGIGLKPSDISGKTAVDAIKLISEKMQGQSAQAKQKILADIFKGAGEDAGLDFIEGFSSVDLDLTKIPAVEQSGSGFKMWMSELSSSAASILGNVGVYAKEMSPFFQVLAGGIPLVQAMTKATWLQAAAQKVLNFIMNLNPIFLIITGVILLTALVYKAIKSFDTWGSTLLAFLGPIGLVISAIMLLGRHWDSIVEAFKSDGIIGALKRIGIVLLDVLMHPLQRILGWVGELTGWNWAKNAAGSVEEFRRKNNLVTSDETKPDPDGEPSPDINGLLSPPNLLSYGPDTGGKKKGKGTKSDDGLNVGSGTGGVKSINMTLNVTNNFSVSKDTNMRQIAEQVTGMINDRLRDAVISIG